MKKLLCTLAVLALSATFAHAAAISSTSIGFLTRLNTSETEFARIIQNSESVTGWHLISNRHELYGVKFYESLLTMQMALNKAEIDEIALPEVVGEYMIEANPEFEACCVARTRLPMMLAFGFRKDDAALAERFNRALRAMNDDWSLAELQGVYIYNKEHDKPVKFETFDDAETIAVAVTGDMPPIDFIDEGGHPAGFNTALLAELGRRLRVNIKLVNVESGARTAALVSGRVDVVFWYETMQGYASSYDAAEGVLLSDPYYSWNTFFHIKKK